MFGAVLKVIKNKIFSQLFHQQLVLNVIHLPTVKI